jgi:hypothetical protein
MVLAAVFAGLAVLLTMVAVVVQPLALFVAVPFGAAAYFMWYQASGRLMRRVYASVEDRARVERGRREERARGGFGAGPREEWDPRSERVRERVDGGRARTGQRERRERVRPPGDDGPTAREAYETLGLDPGADEEAVRQAYREEVKRVHPDAEDGSREEFKRVTAAYERLTEE